MLYPNSSSRLKSNFTNPCLCGSIFSAVIQDWARFFAWKYDRLRETERIFRMNWISFSLLSIRDGFYFVLTGCRLTWLQLLLSGDCRSLLISPSSGFLIVRILPFAMVGNRKRLAQDMMVLHIFSSFMIWLAMKDGGSIYTQACYSPSEGILTQKYRKATPCPEATLRINIGSHIEKKKPLASGALSGRCHCNKLNSWPTA